MPPRVCCLFTLACGVVRHQYIPHGQTINANFYCNIKSHIIAAHCLPIHQIQVLLHHLPQDIIIQAKRLLFWNITNMQVVRRRPREIQHS